MASDERSSSRSENRHPEQAYKLHLIKRAHLELGRILMARDRMITIVKSEIVLSIIINILARRVSGKASVGLKAVAVLYPRYR